MKHYPMHRNTGRIAREIGQREHAINELAKCGIPRAMLKAALDGFNRNEMDRLATLLTKKTRERNKREAGERAKAKRLPNYNADLASVKGHGQVPKALALYCLYVMVDKYWDNEEVPSDEVRALFDELLEPRTLATHGAALSTAQIMGATYLANHPDASNSEIAREADVKRQAVQQWMHDGAFKRRVEMIRRKERLINRKTPRA
jgi:hypothetical protein